MDLRQAASIQFKNVVSKHWRRGHEEGGDAERAAAVGEGDRAFVRENILEAMVTSPPLLKAQMAKAMEYMIAEDFPERWPGLIPAVGRNIASEDQARVLGAMTALRNVARKYEFRDSESRQPLDAVVEQTFPTLLRMLQSIVRSGTAATEAAEIIKLICKTFWSATYIALPPALRDPAHFGAWMEGIFVVINQPVPAAGEPEDHYERQKWPWWKCKKWALSIFNRLFDRYGDPSPLAGRDKEFATAFRANFPVRFLEAYFNLLGAVGRGGYLPDRVVNLCMTFLSDALAKKNTYRRMREHMQALLSRVVFPVLCFSDHDAELWEEDPHEYIRKGYDIIEDMYSPRTAAVNFMLEMARLRARDNNNLDAFLGFVVSELMRYSQAPAGAGEPRRKDGAMLAVGSLCAKLKGNAAYRAQLEPMILNHILPEFQSPHGHLRAKAAWVCGQYADIEFEHENLFKQLFERVLMGVRDPELPVRVDSVVALKEFVEASQTLDELRAILPQLLGEFFSLINEVENEDLVLTLETIVNKFGEEIAPYAKSLCQNLGAAFWKIMCTADGGGDDDDDGPGVLAAVSSLRAICTILESVSNLPQMYPELEPILCPIMHKMISTDGQDVFEEVLEMMSYVTYFGPGISPAMWALYPQLCRELDAWAVDYFENMLVPMDNFISHGTEVFLTSRDPDYLGITLHVVGRVIGNDEIAEDNMKPGALLLSSILQNCRGRVDEYLERFLAVCWQRLAKGVRMRRLKDVLMDVFMDALYYNPVLTLDILRRHGLLGELFTTLFSMISAARPSGRPKFLSSETSKKMAAMGLLSILGQPSTALPAEVLQGFSTIMACVLSCLVRLKEQIGKREEEEGEEEDEEEEEDLDGEDDDDGGGGGGGGEELGIDEEETDDEVFSILQSKQIHLRAFSADDGSDDDEDSDADSEDFWGYDDEFQSPLDKVDPFVFFADTMEAIRATDAERFASISSQLDAQQQQALAAVVEHSKTRREEMAKAELEAKAAAGAT